MNKKKLFNIFILLFIMGFVLPLNTKALTFTDCKGVSHNVDSSDTMIDFLYFTKDSNTTGFVIGQTFSGSEEYFQYLSVSCENPIFAKYSSSNYRFYSGTQWCTKYERFYYTCSSNYSTCTRTDYNSNGIQSSVTLIYNPILYNGYQDNTIFQNASSYNEQSILTKYNCNGGSVEPEPEPEPEPTDEEVNMFDVVETFLIQFINILPFLIPFILVMNLVCRMLFNERS